MFLKFSYFKVQKDLIANPALQGEWSKRKLVWVPHETEGFVAGSLVDTRGDEVVVEIVETGKVLFHKHTLCFKSLLKIDLLFYFALSFFLDFVEELITSALM